MKADIAHVQEIVSEIFLDHVPLRAAADDKLVDAMGAVELENVPEDWLAADLHHWLWFEVGFFADAGAEAARED